MVRKILQMCDLAHTVLVSWARLKRVSGMVLGLVLGWFSTIVKEYSWCLVNSGREYQTEGGQFLVLPILPVFQAALLGCTWYHDDNAVNP